MNHSPWFVRLAGSEAARLRLFAFPYSGGSAASYAHWRRWLRPDVELLGVQIPGRSTRMGEPLMSDMGRLVAELVPQLLPLLDKPYQMFGHSNGALMAFAALNRLLALGAAAPEAVILSAKRSPTVACESERFSTLPEDEFLQKLKEMNGTPQELLDNPEFMRLLSPVIRADFALGESFALGAIDPRVAGIPALIFAGQGDRMPVADVFAWSAIFPKSSTVVLKGGHFCINIDPVFPQKFMDFCHSGGDAARAA